MEEAQVIATEYIYSLENLPGEIQFLLTEIKLKDEKSQEIQSDIHLKTQRYIRHSIKANGTGKDPPTGIEEQYAELEKLALDKQRLAQRLVDIIGRACGRLDVDLAKISTASGEPADLNNIATGVGSQPSWTQARAAADKLRESLKADLDLSSAATGATTTGANSAVGHVPKRRRLNPPAEPSPMPSGPSTPRSGRVSALNSRAHRSASVADVEPDADAEGDDDDGKGDGEGDQDDQRLYCYCRKRSYGEMVACDNPDCPYQWFHINCLQIKGSLPERWYCQDCEPKFQTGTTAEKGRKGRKPRNQ